MDWRALNRAMWDERVPVHVASTFYDVAGFKRGKSTLRAFELDELGSVQGRELVHLQCHFGLDTLSWARQGAKVTGLDFSAPAVAAAQCLAAEIGIDARFVCADVYEAVTALGGQFDVVYTGLGALCWLPDIERWAATVAQLLRPGGTLYLVEFHPLTDIFSYADLSVAFDYFHDPAGSVDETPGTYADRSAPTAVTRSVEWRHTLGDIVTAIAQQGLRIDLLHEFDTTLFERWPLLERSNGVYRLPAGLPRLPLMFSLRATQSA